MLSHVRSVHLAGILFATVCALVIGFPATSHAASTTGISVSPAELNFSLAKADTQQTMLLTLSNSYDSPVELSAQFKGIDEKAGLLIPTEQLDASFANTLHITQTDIHIAARSSTTVFVQAINQISLSPGGHYATLVLTQIGLGKQQLSLQSSISLSLFVVKQDGAEEHLAATNLKTNGWLFHRPTTATLQFNNNGNVHVVPRAVVAVSGWSNKVLANGVLNTASFPLLPGASLASQTQLQSLDYALLPQKLHIKATYRADGSNTITSLSRNMLYIPPLYPILLFVLFGLFIRRHNVKRSRPTASPITSSTITPSPVELIIPISSETIIAPTKNTVNIPVFEDESTDPVASTAVQALAAKTKAPIIKSKKSSSKKVGKIPAKKTSKVKKSTGKKTTPKATPTKN